MSAHQWTMADSLHCPTSCRALQNSGQSETQPPRSADHPHRPRWTTTSRRLDRVCISGSTQVVRPIRQRLPRIRFLPCRVLVSYPIPLRDPCPSRRQTVRVSPSTRSSFVGFFGWISSFQLPRLDGLWCGHIGAFGTGAQSMESGAGNEGEISGGCCQYVQ